MKRQYSKPPLIGSQQIKLLKKRGLIIEDIEEATQFLENHSYYRFSAYTYVFENNTSPEKRDHQFIAGTRFSDVHNIYKFDQELRMILFSALSSLEVALRTRICLELANHHSSGFFYLHERHYKDREHGLSNFLSMLDTATQKSREVFITHYKKHYDLKAQGLPLWFAIEILSFGQVSRFFDSLTRANQKVVARGLGIRQDQLLPSWLEFLSYIRNICAHHSRLWNRKLTKTPKNDRDIRLLQESSVAQAILVIAKLYSYCELPLDFLKDLERLFKSYPEITPERLGFSGIQFGDIQQLASNN